MQGIGSVGIKPNLFTEIVKNEIVNTSEDIVVKDKDKSFSDVMKDTIEKVNDSQINANNKIEDFIKGEDVTMHEVMIAVQESQMSMQLMLEVRNKVYEAYQEINRVQL